MVGASQWRSSEEPVRAARCGSEDCKLRDALCIRAAPRIPDRCVDGARFETAIFSAGSKIERVAAAWVFRNILWRTRWLRAAIFVSSCAGDVAKIRSIEKFLGSTVHFRLIPAAISRGWSL